MTGKCLSLDELKAVDSLGIDDSRRRHFDQCPRCRARLASYRDFMEPAASPPGSKPEEADAHLAAILDQELMHAAVDRTASRSTDEPGPGSFLASLLRSLWKPALRPVWAIGIVVLAFLGIREVRDWQSDQAGRIILRQGTDAAAVAVANSEAELQPDGSILLSWEATIDADGYRIAFLGTELTELRNMDTGSKTSILISKDLLAELQQLDETLFWQVQAFRGGDEIASSELQHLEIPR